MGRVHAGVEDRHDAPGAVEARVPRLGPLDHRHALRQRRLEGRVLEDLQHLERRGRELGQGVRPGLQGHVGHRRQLAEHPVCPPAKPREHTGPRLRDLLALGQHGRGAGKIALGQVPAEGRASLTITRTLPSL